MLSALVLCVQRESRPSGGSGPRQAPRVRDVGVHGLQRRRQKRDCGRVRRGPGQDSAEEGWTPVTRRVGTVAKDLSRTTSGRQSSGRDYAAGGTRRRDRGAPTYHGREYQCDESVPGVPEPRGRRSRTEDLRHEVLDSGGRTSFPSVVGRAGVGLGGGGSLHATTCRLFPLLSRVERGHLEGGPRVPETRKGVTCPMWVGP